MDSLYTHTYAYTYLQIYMYVYTYIDKGGKNIIKTPSLPEWYGFVVTYSASSSLVVGCLNRKEKTTQKKPDITMIWFFKYEPEKGNFNQIVLHQDNLASSILAASSYSISVCP